MLGAMTAMRRPVAAALRGAGARLAAAIVLGWAAPIAQPLAAGAAGHGTIRMVAASAARSGGCGLAPSPGRATLSIRLAGRARTVLVDVPSDYTGTTPVPLVINLQANRSTASREAALSGMDTEADQAGFIVAYPQAVVASGAGFSWSDPGAAQAGPASPNDLAFLTAVPGALEARYCVDSTRVYVTGFGAGADMAAQVACDDSNIFAALGAVSGLHWPASCPAIRPLAVIAFQGSADRTGVAGRGAASGSDSVAQAARAWAAQDGCGGRPLSVVPASGARLTAYVGCRAKVEVELYTVLGQGHEWPGGPPLPRSVTERFGAQSSALDANQLMWAFFESHRLP